MDDVVEALGARIDGEMVERNEVLPDRGCRGPSKAHEREATEPWSNSGQTVVHLVGIVMMRIGGHGYKQIFEGRQVELKEDSD